MFGFRILGEKEMKIWESLTEFINILFFKYSNKLNIFLGFYFSKHMNLLYLQFYGWVTSVCEFEFWNFHFQLSNVVENSLLCQYIQRI